MSSSIISIECGDRTIDIDEGSGSVYIRVSKGLVCKQRRISSKQLIILALDENGNVVGVEVP